MILTAALPSRVNERLDLKCVGHERTRVLTRLVGFGGVAAVHVEVVGTREASVGRGEEEHAKRAPKISVHESDICRARTCKIHYPGKQ